MSKVVNDFNGEATSLGFGGNICVAKRREYVENMYEMFFQRSQVCDDAVRVNELKLPCNS